MSQRKLKTYDLEIKIRLLIITINGKTKYSLIEGDLDNHQTEIDFGSLMKNLMFDLSLTRVYRPKYLVFKKSR